MTSPLHPIQLPSHDLAVFRWAGGPELSDSSQADDGSEPNLAIIVRINVSHNKAHRTELSFLATHDYRCGISGIDEFFARCHCGLGHGPGFPRWHCGSKHFTSMFLDAYCGIPAPPHSEFNANFLLSYFLPPHRLQDATNRSPEHDRRPDRAPLPKVSARLTPHSPPLVQGLHD